MRGHSAQSLIRHYKNFAWITSHQAFNVICHLPMQYTSSALFRLATAGLPYMMHEGHSRSSHSSDSSPLQGTVGNIFKCTLFLPREARYVLQTSCRERLPSSCPLLDSPDPSKTQSIVDTVLSNNIPPCASWGHNILMAVIPGKSLCSIRVAYHLFCRHRDSSLRALLCTLIVDLTVTPYYLGIKASWKIPISTNGTRKPCFNIVRHRPDSFLHCCDTLTQPACCRVHKFWAGKTSLT